MGKDTMDFVHQIINSSKNSMITLYVKFEDEDICAAFQELGPPRRINRVVIYQGGKSVLCDVTGWKSDPTPSPTPALAQKITDSGDAQAILIHGGDLGILLKPAILDEPWDPSSPNQEPRAYMVISRDSEIHYDEP